MMEHLQEESNCSMSGGLDLYSDILTEDVKQREHTFDELQNKFEEAQKKITMLENELANQQSLVHEYLKKNSTLQSNISSLFITARRELHRKDSEIRELRNSTPQRHWNGTNPPVKEFSVCGGKGARLTQDSETNAAIFSSQANKPQAFYDTKSPISNRLRVLSQEVCKADLSSSPFSRENRPCRRENRSKDSGKHHSRDRTFTTDECNEVDDSSSSGRLKSRVKRKLSDEDMQDKSKRFRHESSRDAKYDCARKLVERSKKDITRRRESVERSLSCIRIADVENKHKTRNTDTDSDRYYRRNKDRISDGDNKIRRDESKCSKIQSRRKLDSSPERGPSIYIDLREKLRSFRQQKGSEVENTDRDTSQKLVQTRDKDLRGRSRKNDANELAKTNKTVVEESKLSGDFVTVKRKHRYEDDHSLRTRNFNSSRLDTEELIDISEQDDDSVKLSATCKEYYGKRLTDNFLPSQFENANKLVSLNNTCQHVLNKQLVNVRKDFADGTVCEKHIIHQKEKSFPDIHEDAQNLKGTEIHGLKMLPGLEAIRESLQEACFISDSVSTVNTNVVIGEEYNKVEQLLAVQSVNDRVIVITSHDINKTSDKENKDTTDFSTENECITYSKKENKNTNYLDKENKGTTDFSKENDTTYSNKENKETTYSDKENKGTTDISKENDTTYSNKENKETTYSDKENKGTTDISKENETTYLDKENKGTTDFSKENDTTYSNEENKETTYSDKEMKGTTDISKENETTYLDKENKGTTYFSKENDTTYSNKENKETTYSDMENKVTTDISKENDTTYSNKENKETTYSDKENKGTTDISKENETTYLDKENKGTTDFSKENDTTYSNEENKETTYSDKENKGTTYISKENDRTYSNKENKETTYSDKENKGTTDISKENETTYSDKEKGTTDFSKENETAYSNEENKGVTNSAKENIDTTDLNINNKDIYSNTENKDITYSDTENMDTTDFIKDNRDTNSNTKIKDTTDSAKEDKDTADLNKDNKDTTDSSKNKEMTCSYKENKDTTDSCNGNKNITDSYKGSKDTTDLNKNKGATHSNLENKSITYSGKEKICNTGSLEQNKEKSDSGRKNKDRTCRENLTKTDSDKHHTNKTGLNNDKQKHPVRKSGANEVSRNEQQSHKKDHRKKLLNNKEHNQDREQVSTSTATKEKASIAEWRVEKLDAKSNNAAKLDHSEQTCGSCKEQFPTLEHCQDAAIKCHHDCMKPMHSVSNKIDKASRGRHLDKVVFPAVREVTTFDGKNLSNKDSSSGKETLDKKKKKNIVQELERRTSTSQKPAATLVNFIANSADVNVECKERKLSKDRTSSPDNCAESVQSRKPVRNNEKCFDPQGKEIKKLDMTEKSIHNNGKEEKGENRCNNKEKGSKSLNTYLHCRMGGEIVKDKDVIFTLEDSLFNGNSNTDVCSKERNFVENSALLHSPFKDMASADNSVLSDTAKITKTISTSCSDINQTEVLEESAVHKSESNNGYTSPVLSESDKTDRILTEGSMPAIWGSQRCFVTSETEYEFDSDNQSPNHGTYTYSPVPMYNRQLSVKRGGTTTRSLISSKPSSFAKICSSETEVGKSDRTDSGQSGDKPEMNSQVILTTKENSKSVDLIDYVSKQIELEINKSPVVLLPVLPVQRKQIRIDSAKRPELPRKVKKPDSNKTSKYDEVVFDHTDVGKMEGYFPKNSSGSEKNDETSDEEEKPNTKDASGKPCEKFPEQTLSTNDEKRSFDNSTGKQSFINKSISKTCTKTSTVMSLEKPASKATESESLPHKSFDCKRSYMEGMQNCLPLESKTPHIQSGLELEKINVKVKKCEKSKKSGTFQISPVINSHSADISMESPLLTVSRTSNISQTSNRSGLLRDLLGEVSQEIIYLESSKKKAREKMMSSKEETRSDYLLSDGKIDKSSSSLNSSCDLSCYSGSTSLDVSHSPDKSSGTKCVLEPNESISRMSGLTFLFEDLDDESNVNKTTSHEQFQLQKEVDYDVKSVKGENTKKDSSPMTSFQPDKGSCSETVRRDFETCLFGDVSSSSEDSQFSQLTDMKYEHEDEEFTKVDTNAVGVNNVEMIDVNSLDQCNLGTSLSKLSSEEKNMIMTTSREDSSLDVYTSISNTSASLLKGNSYIIEDEMLTFDIPDQSQSHAAAHIFSDGLEGDKSSAVDLLLNKKDSASQIRDDSPMKSSVSLEVHLMEASMKESPVKRCSILTNMVPVLKQNADGSHSNNAVTDVERKIMLTPSPVKQHKSGAFQHQLVTEDLSTKFEKASFSPRRQQKLNDKNQTTEYPFLRTVSSQGVSPGKPFAQSSEKQCNLLSIKSPLKPDNYSLDCLHGVASPLKPKSPVVENIVAKNFNVLPVLGSAQQMAEYENSGNVILHSHINIISPGKVSSANCNFSMERMNTSSNDQSISGHFGINIHFDVRSEDKVVMPGNSLVQHSQTNGAVVPCSVIGDISSLPEKSTCTGKSREFVKSATGEKFSKNGHPVITRKSHLRHNPSPSKSVTSLIEAINNTSFKPGTPRGFDSERTKEESSRTMETKNVIVSDVLHMRKNHSPVKVCHMSFQNKEMIESTQYLVNNSENKTVPNMSSPKKKSKKSNRKQSSVENDLEKMEQSCRKERHTNSNAFSSRSPEGKMSSADNVECTQNLRHLLDNPAKSFPQCLNNVSDICESEVEAYTENTLRSRSKTVNSESKAKGEKCTMENIPKRPEKTNTVISVQIPCTSSPQRKRKESVLIFENELSLHASEESLLNLVDPEIEIIHPKRDSKTRLLKQADKSPVTESIPDPVSPKRPTVRDKKYSKVNSSKVSPEKEFFLGKTSIKNRESNSKKDSKVSLTSPWKELRSSPRRSQINLSPQPCRDQVVGTSSARKRILPSPDKCSNSKRDKISPKNKDASSNKKADNTIANISLEKKSNMPKNTSCAKMLKISPQSGNMGNNLEASVRFSDGRSKISSYKKSCKSSTSVTAGMQCWTSPRIKKTKLLDEVFKSENSRSPKKNLPPNRKKEKVMENDEFCAAHDQDGKNRTRSGLQKSSSKKKLILKGFAELKKKDESPQLKRVIPVPVVTESALTDSSHQISVFANSEQMKSAESMPQKMNIPVTVKDDKNSEMEDQITASKMQQIPSGTVQEHQELLEPVKKKRKLERCSVMVCNIITQEAETEYTNHESSLAKNTMYVEINYDDDAKKFDKIVLHTETDSKYKEKQLETLSRAKKTESSKERTVDSVRKRHISPYSMNRVENYVYDSGAQDDNKFDKEIDGVKVLQREEKLVLGQDERTDVEDDWDSIDEDDIQKNIETEENNSLDSCAEESDNYYYNDFYKNKETVRVNSGERKECFDDPYDDELDDLEEGEISLDSEETLNETLQPGNDADGSDTTSAERVPWKTQTTHQNSVSKGDLAKEDRERKKLVYKTLFSNKDSYPRSKHERKDDHSIKKHESNILDKRLKSSRRLTKSERTNSQRRSKSRSPKPKSSLSKSKSPLSGKKYLQRRSRSRTPQQRFSLSSKSKSRSSEVLDRHSLSSGSRSKGRHRSRERCMFGSQKEPISPRFRRSRRQRSREFPQHRVLTPERRTPRWRKSKEMLTSRGKSPVRVSWSGQKKLSPHEHSRRACKPRRR
ncbi:hypothetical protein ACJMK2_027985 [Sinanodonta woodiana]|uniref:Uncharacterized protein n=1 Tax=Sinanodonta woodiana TaxID=1069815 RepID=A0ABD3X5N3_SINWO